MMLINTRDGDGRDTVAADAGHIHFEPAWKPLRFLNLYRLVIATFFVIIGFSDSLTAPLGIYYPQLYFAVSLFYIAFSALSIFTIDWRKPPFTVQVYCHVLTDIAVIILLMHASGGLKSGLGVLLVVAIAGGSLLTAGRTAILFAALAALAVLLEQIYSQLNAPLLTTNFTHAGLLGATFFATATLAYVLARRVRETEALAAQRGVDIANLEQLTRYIVQRMQTGIMVIDDRNRVRLVNESARHLLGLGDSADKTSTITLPQELAEQLKTWHSDTNYEPYTLRPTKTSPDIMPRFARLGGDESSGTLIFLEDMTSMAQHAQQLKLASLGRLTASIAHEIRNPLGAITYAGQLLAESPNAGASDKRLTQIICDQSRRVNTIVENVLQLSSRKRSQPEELNLKQWLEEFVEEFKRSEGIGDAHIAVAVDPGDLRVRMDPGQLHQVLWNLCHNGLRHSQPGEGQPDIELIGGVDATTQTPYLDVVDHGPGIEPQVAEHIFEPFFTTARQGTGLGLYIARELCEANQARLNYLSGADGGGCFRISFADPRRRQVA